MPFSSSTIVLIIFAFFQFEYRLSHALISNQYCHQNSTWIQTLSTCVCDISMHSSWIQCICCAYKWARSARSSNKKSLNWHKFIHPKSNKSISVAIEIHWIWNCLLFKNWFSCLKIVSDLENGLQFKNEPFSRIGIFRTFEYHMKLHPQTWLRNLDMKSNLVWFWNKY